MTATRRTAIMTHRIHRLQVSLHPQSPQLFAVRGTIDHNASRSVHLSSSDLRKSAIERGFANPELRTEALTTSKAKEWNMALSQSSLEARLDGAVPDSRWLLRFHVSRNSSSLE